MYSGGGWSRRALARMSSRWRRPGSAPQAELEDPSAGARGREVRVLHVGRDSGWQSRRQSCYGSDGGGGGGGGGGVYLGLFDPEPFVPADAVPYLNESDDERIAAHIARRQSLLRRKLRRVGLGLPA
ncbi:hypothetical protein H4R18_002446 [Coemansia javaensis]|uniref:Uncharacterized protein n=1 Tax=Coemansia javaensis TaxID=2761396 RepID=A0A9W8HIF4_9FUNG|nr:hypothetical protein H4R18_002446 [Coemansia javaensis]